MATEVHRGEMELDDQNLDSDLEAFQFIHEESIKDENIASIIEDLMTIDDMEPNADHGLKSVKVNIKKLSPGKMSKPVKINSKPIKMKISTKDVPTIVASKPAKMKMPSADAAVNCKPAKMRKVILADKKQLPACSNIKDARVAIPFQIYQDKPDPAVQSPKNLAVQDKENIIIKFKRPDEEVFKHPSIIQQQQFQSLPYHANKVQTKVSAPMKSVPISSEPPQNHTEPAGNLSEPAKDLTEPIVTEKYSSRPDDSFIGDWKRMFVTFDHLEENSYNSIEYKVERFMQNLDTWGVSKEVPRPVFDGFSCMESDPCKDLGLDIPQDWMDESVFTEIDRMVVSENVFLHKWLPKCALKMRINPYREMLRKLNEKDPYFNITF
eukprot:TRINITY_DN30177_c0_g1_i3.p1 TRINITY_DN30177_c0_g1~~TRINITY_DN30177_c0_g1_i3.p1  ORF type:complete len:380 (+),score=78.61 TRINITY_DN30177_c0_g1_i3:66-1205(+)